MPDSGLTAVFRSIFPLFEEDALESVRRSGMFALSEPGRLDEVLVAVPLTPYDDEEIECRIAFDDVGSAERAFLGAGATQLAIGASGEAAVAEALRTGLEPFVEAGGRVVLPTWFRVALAAAR